MHPLRLYSQGRLTTTITSKGELIDIFAYSPDSLAFLVRCLRVAKAKDLIKKYNGFLNREVDRYYKTVIDEKTGLVRQDREFSSIKDQALRRSSCYNNVMTAMLSDELDILGLRNPFKKIGRGKHFKTLRFKTPQKVSIL